MVPSNTNYFLTDIFGPCTGPLRILSLQIKVDLEIMTEYLPPISRTRNSVSGAIWYHTQSISIPSAEDFASIFSIPPTRIIRCGEYITVAVACEWNHLLPCLKKERKKRTQKGICILGFLKRLLTNLKNSRSSFYVRVIERSWQTH